MLAITCYDELAARKGIVLVRGEIVGGLSKEVSVLACFDCVSTSFLGLEPCPGPPRGPQEAQALMRTILDCYLVESKLDMVRTFNQKPREFDFNKLLRLLGLSS